jgi:hypothetical protein
MDFRARTPLSVVALFVVTQPVVAVPIVSPTSILGTMPVSRFVVSPKNIPGHPGTEPLGQGRPIAGGGGFRHWL